jgi:hypothetical protein
MVSRIPLVSSLLTGDKRDDVFGSGVGRRIRGKYTTPHLRIHNNVR